MRLSLVVITLNEEEHLADCLRSVPFADEIVVVDSGSRDRTADIARELGAKVIVRPFTDFADQKNFAMDQASGEWLLLLDADERLSDPLQREILETVQRPDAVDGYYLRRENHLFGGRMRFGGNAGDEQLRLLRKGKGRFKGIVHERIELEGRAGRLKEPALHFSTKDVQEYWAKFPQFCSLDAERAWKEGVRPVFYHIWIKPVLSFTYFYIVKLGFLDGRRGLLYEALSARYLHSKYKQAAQLCRERGRP